MPTHPPQTAQGVVRTGQIIVAALMAGVIIFGVITLLVARDQGRPNEPFLALIGAAAAGTLLVLRVVLPPRVAASACRQLQPNPGQPITADQLYPVFQSTLIVGAALLEAGTFFNLMLYLIAGQWWSIAIAAALVLGIACSFPTRDSLERWVTNRLTEIDLERATHPNN